MTDREHFDATQPNTSIPRAIALGTSPIPSLSSPVNAASNTNHQPIAVVAVHPTMPREAEAASSTSIKSESPDESESLDDDSQLVGFAGLVNAIGACSFSMVVHVVVLLALAFWILPEESRSLLQTLIATPFDERPEDSPAEFELANRIEVVTEPTAIETSLTAPIQLPGAVGGTIGSPVLDARVVEQTAFSNNISVDYPTLNIPAANRLITAVPEGEYRGESRAIVDDYQQAMDRITQEIVWMLDKGHVHVAWLFDQSESMKDDQQEIRDRVELVYSQLGLSGRTQGESLTTAIASFGGGYIQHTKRPTSDILEIRQAIDRVPVDHSGLERTCSAIGKVILDNKDYCRKGKRQFALIVVTDESGDRENNDRFMEAAIAEAKSAGCKIYVLGREAVFGFPYAHMRWIHPITKRGHWLPVDRGPETAFVEQLQTNGFHRRHDAFSSGFGPYELVRVAWETGGIFFMLPSVETDIVQGDKRRYDLELMRPFRPDLRARVEIVAERDKVPLRVLVCRIINDLNPFQPKIANIIELRTQFSINPSEFVKQARMEQQKAKICLNYLAKAQEALEQGQNLRKEEADPRWQANYDLILAQIVAYQARIYEYGAGLDDFIQHPKVVPAKKGPDLVHDTWDISTRKQTLTKESEPYVARATQLLRAVRTEYPGTPWAARAEWELGRGFGIDVVPSYEPPLPDKAANSIPIPKL